MAQRYHILVLTLIFLAITFVYRNHFDNTFQFDDSHTIVVNPFIRDLSNATSFFTNARTGSVHPANQGYRPLTTLSLAIDYAVGGGLIPFWFHLSTFLWFLALVLGIFALYRRILVVSELFPTTQTRLALFATAWFALHPVAAETVNYIIQRADLYATIACVLGILAFANQKMRRWRLYLVPFICGCFAKQSTLIFPLLLGAYILLIEGDNSTRRFTLAALRPTITPFIIAIGFFLFQTWMTPPTASTGGGPPMWYFVTQSWILLRYITAIFAPLYLSADTDEQLILTFADPRLAVGLATVGLLSLLLLWALRNRARTPLAFGIIWFVVSLIPTSSFISLAEVMNDHRMFTPFVGGILAASWLLNELLSAVVGWTKLKHPSPAIASILATLFLLQFAYGTYSRNEVWHSHRSLWQDAVAKSPRNGRAKMNLGLTYMQEGDYATARQLFLEAEQLLPRYGTLQVNLGIVCAALGDFDAALPHFERAISYDPINPNSYIFYGSYLERTGAKLKAQEIYTQGLAVIPTDPHLKEKIAKLLLNP